MSNHPVKKFLGLTILYAVVIIGIFVIQFKTESVISHSVGELRISLAQTASESNIMELQNQLQASFKGIYISFDENNPAMAINPDNTYTNLTLESWKAGDTSAEFRFTDGSEIMLSLSGTEPDAQLSVVARPSADARGLILPYRTASGYSLDNITESRIILSSKTKRFAFTAPLLEQRDGINFITFLGKESSATFAEYNPELKFTFDSALALSRGDEQTYAATVRQVRATLMQRVSQSFSGTERDSLTEKDIMAYIAEMAFNGRYTEALDAVPESFKNGNKRTFASSPYFNNLVSMNRTLTMQTEKYSSQVDSALSSSNPDLFTIDGIADYLLRIKRTARAQMVLEMPSKIQGFKPTLSQAAGLLSVYSALERADSYFASPLKDGAIKCLETIEGSLSIRDDRLIIHENGSQPDTETVIRLGIALVNSGAILENPGAAHAGRILVSTALSNPGSADLHLLGELYPLMVENTFYPHTQILGYYNNTAVWAWTCATSISYTLSADSIASINIEFPLNYTHYIIFSGIPNFNSQIEIQGMMFRTDPRFETYNSSGYVYQAGTGSLLIKSRHKNRTELIRLFCNPTSSFVTLGGEHITTRARAVTSPAAQQTPPSPAQSPAPAAEEAEPAEPQEPPAPAAENQDQSL
ncbi:MAG: hypothetical protein J1F14_01075 [Treponema sp.]|nr:hypothetical protein [Treponema sp.]